MVGLASLFLTIIYIGAIFLRKKFSSALASFIGVSSGHSHQMSAATGRLARRMLLDIGLDALPLIGPILGGRRRRSESGESGLSTMDEIKLWWKSRRGGKSGPVYDRSIEGRPPVGRPDAENPNSGDVGGPSSPETNTRFNGRTERDDRPVFVYADRKSAAPEEGTPPEPAGGIFDIGSNAGVRPKEGEDDESSLIRPRSDRGGEQPERRPPEVPAAQRDPAQEGTAQKRGKLSDFYDSRSDGKTNGFDRVQPREVYPAERVISELSGTNVQKTYSNTVSRSEREAPQTPAQSPAERGVSPPQQRLRPAQESWIKERHKGISTEEAGSASSSRLGEHKPAQTSPIDFSHQEVPARNRGGDEKRLPQEQRKVPPARESRLINREASSIGRGSKNDVSMNKTIESQVPTAGRDAR